MNLMILLLIVNLYIKRKNIMKALLVILCTTLMIVCGILSKLLWITTAIGFVLYLLNIFNISGTIVLNLFIGSFVSTLITILSSLGITYFATSK